MRMGLLVVALQVAVSSHDIHSPPIGNDQGICFSVVQVTRLVEEGRIAG